MGFQIFPEPSTGGAEDTSSFGFFHNTSVALQEEPISSDPFGNVRWEETTSVPKGFYLAQPTNSATSGYVLFNNVQVTPSTTSVVSARVATSGTSAAMVIKSQWTNGSQSSYLNITTGVMTSWNVFQNTNDNVFIATFYTDGSPSYGNPAAISTNGTSWTRNFIGMSTGNAPAAYASFAKNGEYFIVSNTGIKSSTDLLNWTTKSGFNNFGNTVEVIYHQPSDKFIAGSTALNGVYRDSTDAITWTTRSFSDANSQVFGIKEVNGLIFAYGGSASVNRPTIQVSTNGVNWATTDTINSDAQWSTQGSPRVSDITYQNGRYFATVYRQLGFGGSLGYIITSTNGINWSAGMSNSSTKLYSLLADGTYVIAFGLLSTTNGMVWTTNGTNWTAGFPNAIATSSQDNTGFRYGNWAAYVPNNSTSKYFSNGWQQGKEIKTITYSAFESGAPKHSRRVGGDSSSAFQVLVEKYNLSLDNTL